MNTDEFKALELRVKVARALNAGQTTLFQKLDELMYAGLPEDEARHVLDLWMEFGGRSKADKYMRNRAGTEENNDE